MNWMRRRSPTTVTLTSAGIGDDGGAGGFDVLAMYCDAVLETFAEIVFVRLGIGVAQDAFQRGQKFIALPGHFGVQRQNGVVQVGVRSFNRFGLKVGVLCVAYVRSPFLVAMGLLYQL